MVHFKDEEGTDMALRLREEFETKLDPRLRALLLEVGRWQMATFGIPLVVTCLIRTLSENMDVGGKQDSSHILKAGDSYARAADLRNHDLTAEQAKQRRDYILIHFNWKVPLLFHVLDHDSGHGAHTHININYSYAI
jgi:hypothetical protein